MSREPAAGDESLAVPPPVGPSELELVKETHWLPVGCEASPRKSRPLRLWAPIAESPPVTGWAPPPTYTKFGLLGSAAIEKPIEPFPLGKVPSGSPVATVTWGSSMPLVPVPSSVWGRSIAVQTVPPLAPRKTAAS